MRNIFLRSALVISIVFAASFAKADIIDYTISGTFIQVGGNNATGLAGAQFTFHSQFDTAVAYVDRFGFPAAAGASPTVSISGATVAGNNGSVGVSNGAAFYPSFAGVFSEPGGLLLNIFLAGSGDNVDFALFTNATATGAAASIGGLPLLSDFAPATLNSDGAGTFTRFEINGTATYDLANSSISAFVIPEPSSLAILALGTIGLFGRRRRKI